MGERSSASCPDLALSHYGEPWPSPTPGPSRWREGSRSRFPSRWREGLGVGHFGNGLADARNDTLRVSQRIIVGEAQDDEPVVAHPAIALGVVCRTQIVREAIEFDHQIEFTAQEVPKIGSHRHLAAEFHAKL